MRVVVMARAAAAIGVMLLAGAAGAQDGKAVTLTISPKTQGVSTRWIGFCGPWGYNSEKIRDIGFNNMRIWCDLDWFEPTNDTPEYGKLTPDAIRANPNVIPWVVWDKAGAKHRKLLDDMKRDGVRLYVCLRHTGPNHGPGWMANPLKTDADKNEWWEHVYATVYWLNVRNNYRVDFWEVFNEPSLPEQGWKGTEAEYLEFLRLTNDAIQAVYKKYLPGRTPHVGAPSLHYPQVGGDGSVPNSKGWLGDALALSPLPFNAITYHNYATGPQMRDGMNFVRFRMSEARQTDLPIWLTEWGSYDKGTKEEKLDPHGNDNVPFAVRVIGNLIDHSAPGAAHAEGLHYYLWRDGGYGDGILTKDDQPRTVYYALRLGTRALQGGKPVHPVASDDGDVSAIVTEGTGKDKGRRYLLVINTHRTDTRTVSANLTPLLPKGATPANVALWRYDKDHADVSDTAPKVDDGKVQVTVPPSGAVLLAIGS